MTTLNINGKRVQTDAADDTPLLWVLRDHLDMTGTKFGCGMALCGACTVHVDGVAVRSCITTVDSLGTSDVTTIEGVAGPEALAVQRAWIARDVPQCGYCQSGQIMAAASLLAKNSKPTDADIDSAMTNICRCGTYQRIRAAVHRAAGMLAGKKA